MKSESKPRSSTTLANSWMPRARSGPSPSQMYEGRKTPNRPTSLTWMQPPWGSASAAAVLGIAPGEERVRAFQHVVAGEDPLRRVELGGKTGFDVPVDRDVNQALCLADGQRAPGGDLLGHRVGRGQRL